MSVIQKLKIRFCDHFDGHMIEVMRGASVAFVLKIVGAGLRFAVGVVVARLLGVEGAGVFFLALTVSTLATVIGRVGLDSVLLRFVAANAEKEAWAAVRGIYQKAMRIAFFASLSIAVLVGAFAPFWAQKIFGKPDLAWPIFWTALTVPPLVFVFLYGELLKGIRKIGDSELVQGVGVPALTLVLLVFIGRRFGASGAIFATGLAALGTALWGWRRWWIRTPELRCVKGDFPVREILAAGLPLMIIMLCETAVQWVGILVLGIFGTKADVGIFGAVSRIAMLTSFVLTSVNSIAAPKYAAFFAVGRHDEVGRIARNTTMFMIFLTSPILGCFVFFPETVLGIFGGEFVLGAQALVILAIGQFINLCTGSVGFILVMGGNERALKNIVLCSAMLNILLTIALAPAYGVSGVAFAAAFSVAVSNGFKFYAAWAKTGVWAFPVFVPTTTRD